ncbi:hypothetical protein [Pedobacter duraquae]|uniref:YhhN-like protein n=1 Tax=Pedobacter duraquae TaxID=425511 RepID=A0A4R6INR4_9SPHI|nr:hypothetical protein [Pedobacter duraquae]TDO23880.1 hypothetical protein CLV32_0166 [Pedobacter duraquae]
MTVITLNIVVELICFMVALICLLRIKVWRSQIVYLFLICATEIFGRVLLKVMGQVTNSWLYNIFLVIEAFFVVYMFYSLMAGKVKHVNIYTGVYVVVFLASYSYGIFAKGFMEFNDFCNTVVSICYCIMGMYYFYWLMNRDEYVAILRFAPFWWVAGTLLYYFGSTVLNIFHDTLINMKDHSIRRYMMQFINIVLYGAWANSFIIKRWGIKN